MASKENVVLICCDTSDNSEHCIQWYFNRLHKPENQVEFLHVEDVYNNIHSDMNPLDMDMAMTEIKDITMLLKRRVLKIAGNAGCEGVEFMVRSGRDVWHSIIKVAEERKADMIVMGSKGRGVLRRTLIGSVCDSVVHHAHIPVIVIRDASKHKKH